MNWFHYLPLRVLCCVQALPAELLSRVTEVRLREGKPLSVTVGGKNILLGTHGTPTDARGALRVTQTEIDDMLARLTEGSRYAFDEQMACGFLTLKDGCRAGIAGEMIPHPTVSGAYLFGRITSVNLRIARFVPDFAHALAARLREKPTGALVISPPAGGKTTFLRSAAHLLASGTRPFRVGIADERQELAVSDGLCDRIAGCPKAKAIELLTRTMSPEFLICDELGAGEETALLAAQNTGVHLLASAHGGSAEQALCRPCVRALYKAGVFGLLVLLSPGYGVQIVEEAPCV